ncbi:MAG: hypothetical protein QOH91_2834 [Mycobacterium sp.]|jgi:hypothetical protein|nr:hypothetical protein [Mycobacterium sp.]
MGSLLERGRQLLSGFLGCAVAGHHRTTAAGACPRRDTPEKAVTVGLNFTDLNRRATN